MHLKQRAAVAAGALAVIATGAVIARAADGSGAQAAQGAQAAGGLAVAPSLVERTAQAGAANTVTIANRSREPLAITVKARPWKQASSGGVSPNRRATLGTIAISDTSFTLAAGASKAVTVTLRSAPPYQYGALEVVGLPTDLDERRGVVAGYRIVGSLRYTPASKRYALKAAKPKLSRKALTLAVRNRGNTIDPVSGTLRLKGPLGTRNASIKATRIVPGKSVRFQLARNLRPGRYSARVVLKQGSETTTVNKTITVRR